MFALGLIVYRISVCSKENERKQKYGIAYIQLFVKSVIQAVKSPSEWEGRISFPKMLVVILGTYYISFFGVHQIDEKRIFFCLIFLLIAYCNNKAYLTAYE